MHACFARLDVAFDTRFVEDCLESEGNLDDIDERASVRINIDGQVIRFA
jgi:hypothetical protein